MKNERVGNPVPGRPKGKLHETTIEARALAQQPMIDLMYG